jgi:hypothetical protein
MKTLKYSQKVHSVKLSSSDAMSPSHSKMGKNFITDAETTELLPFKY